METQVGLVIIEGLVAIQSGNNPRVVQEKPKSYLAEAAKPVRVGGHTDNVPIHNVRFKSNWQLSTERAAYVTTYLISKFQMIPELFSASGYSEYHPLAPNDTPENQAKNRRVAFVILDKVD
jgi:chemotaxis protein MotB